MPPWRIECTEGALLLEGYYEVMFACQPVGKVQVLKQGLYYRFVCRCKFSADGVYRLVMLCGQKRENIGVVVPEGEGFGLDKKIPAKQLCSGTPEFYLAPMHDKVQGKFVPISPEEPFGYIARLKDAFLTEQGGQTGIWIPDKT